MGQFSFTKADRLLKRGQFLHLARSGKRVQNDYFIAIFSPSECDRTRLGITVTKKIGTAVKRNRIKRLVRECFRLNRNDISGFWDINIIAKKKAADLSQEQIFEALCSVFKKISG